MGVGGVDSLSLVDYQSAQFHLSRDREERHTVHHAKEGTDATTTS